jgi:hypothetical protein
MINRTALKTNCSRHLQSTPMTSAWARVRAVAQIFGSAQSVASSRVTAATNVLVRKSCLTNC